MTEEDEEAMMDNLIGLIAVGYAAWLLLFPESFIAVSRHLRSRYGYATQEPKTTIFMRAFGGICLLLILLSLSRRWHRG